MSRIKTGFPTVSPREREVWKGVALGETTRAIAAQLGTSPKTVGNQRDTLMRKIGARNAADLTRLAVRHGVIQVEVLQ